MLEFFELFVMDQKLNLISGTNKKVVLQSITSYHRPNAHFVEAASSLHHGTN